MKLRWVGIVAGLSALAACDMPSGEGERQEVANQAAAERQKALAEGKAEEGRLSIRAPGLDLAINVPEGMRSRARADTDSEVLPPGSQVSGIHVEGDGGSGDGGDSVELRFAVAQPVEEIARWYRDPGRREHFTISEARREGEETVLSGNSADGGGPIMVRLRAAAGGTDGRLILVDRD